MRLLCVTEDVPNRDAVHGDGSSMISYELLLALPEAWRTTLVTFAGAVDVPPAVRDRCAEVVVLPLARVPAHPLPLRDPAVRARSAPSARRLVTDLSRTADATLLHGPGTLGLARAVDGPLVVQTVDPWSHALGLRAGQTRGVRGLYWTLRRLVSLALERALPARARLLTVGEADARSWARALRRPVRAVASGVDVRARTPRTGPRTPTVCLVGSLDYPPNIEAAQRLVERVLPLLREQVRDVRVVLAGRNPVDEVRRLAGPGLTLLADVADVADVFDDADVAVFPDLHGTGVRNTVQEALVAGLPVVATPVAARELPPHPACRVVETDAELADAAATVLTGAPAPGGPAPAAAPRTRSWARCAADYVEELEAAVEDGAGAGRQRRIARRLRR